jgi:hypothetical protein
VSRVVLLVIGLRSPVVHDGSGDAMTVPFGLPEHAGSPLSEVSSLDG